MCYKRIFLRWFKQHGCWLCLFLFNPCFAQTTKINELLGKLKQPMADSSRLKVLQQLSTAYSSVDLQKKFYYASASMQLAQKLHNEIAIADAYINMGVSYGLRSRIDSALYYFTLGYNHAEKIKYDMGMGRSQVNIGFAYDRLDNKQEAIKNYFQGLAIFKRIKNGKGINQCYTNIGSIYYDLREYKIAKSYFSQCLVNYTQNKDEVGISNALFTMGNCYQALGEDDKAFECFSKSLIIRTKLGDIGGSALVHRGLGMVYLREKKYDQAISNLDTALNALTKLQEKYEQCATLMTLVDVYLAKGDYNKAEGYALQGLKIGYIIKSKTAVAEALEKLVSIYKNKHQIEKAFDYQSKYIAIQDSILAEKALKDVTLTEFSRTRAENEALYKNNQIIASKNTGYATRIKRYGNVIVVVTVILVSVILFLLILYRRNLEKQATNKLLLKQKEEIASINQELEALNEEVIAQMELANVQNAELEKLNAIKNKFFSIISHDLRGPLSTLQTLFSIYREGDIGEKELGALLSRLEDTILSTGAFLDNLLEWSKSQLEGIIINAVNFNVNDCIAENVHLFESQINLKNLKVINQALEPVVAHADQNMINMVIRNLLSNSIKFCSPGDEITLFTSRQDNKVVISISDTGPGINEADREKLFNLEHVLSTGTHGEKGNHLGLILCRDMVIQNSGKIWFETKQGEGTTFWVELPAGI